MIVAIIPGFALMPRLCHQQVVERSRTPVAEMFDDTHHQIGAASPYPAYDRWLDTQGVCQSPVSTSCPTFLHHWTCQPGLHPGDHVTRGGQREPEPVPIADGTRGLAPAVTRHHGVPGLDPDAWRGRGAGPGPCRSCFENPKLTSWTQRGHLHGESGGRDC
ncbi:uncharacterized protein LOC123612664 isoform X11 [Camelus bactrianus]|uniref:Uncharacterized protein LOC123612664 isoform X11 n=1 Tax=Camelus bactrianus TaxID=9837 RepID=A0AC58Q9W5_CAMBA